MTVKQCRGEGRKVNRVTEKENQIPWLYEWLGGAEVQNALMVKFYERVSADELLRPLFGDMPADHPRHVAGFVGEVADTRPCWRITSGKIFRRRSGGG
jgi:hypothetical protein